MFEKVLVADYSVETRARFYEILSSLAYKVSCVPTGEEVVLRLREERPDLIILDENVPGLSAIATLKKIREFDREVNIIILSEKESIIDKESIPKGPKTPVTMKIKKDFSTHLMMKEILEILKEKNPPRLGEIVPQESKGPVFVVDDNNEIREVLWSFLTKRGYNVLMASSGEEVLMRLKTEKERPRVVLLDIRMPGMDGIMVLKQIKELDESIQVVMLTSAQDEYIMKEAKDVGASDYLTKPCDFSKLDALLLSLLVSKKEFRKNKGEYNNGTET